VPYRIDVRDASDSSLDRLIELGALDVEPLRGRAIAAIVPDSVTPAEVASGLGVDDFSISAAVGRDNNSVWVLSPRPIRIGSLSIVPAHVEAEAGVLRLIDAAAFGTGLHPTTALCLEALAEIAHAVQPSAVLDVGTGSGVLALAALVLGIPRALAIDVDHAALRVVIDNACLNKLAARLRVACGGPGMVTGTWPLVLANILAAPLIEMAPTLVRRVGHHGQLVLSGIPKSVEQEVAQAYMRLGMHRVNASSRDGWVALVLRASW
jgi:ribosomal protein L11 methyltransferase